MSRLKQVGAERDKINKWDSGHASVACLNTQPALHFFLAFYLFAVETSRKRHLFILLAKTPWMKMPLFRAKKSVLGARFQLQLRKFTLVPSSLVKGGEEKKGEGSSHL